MHLSLLEHGVYNQLLDWYYLDEQPIPIDNRTLFRRLSARSEIEQQAVLDVLAEMFVQTDAGWVHKRVEREITLYRAKAEQARAAGKLGGRPRKTDDGSKENRDGFEKEAGAKPTANHKPITNQPITTSPNGDGDKPDAAGFVDPCPHQQIIELYHAALPTGRQVREWTAARATALRTRWRENPKRQTLDWWRRFFDYCAKSPFLTGQVTSVGRKPFEVSLDWLVKSENMAKVIEGAYHEAEREAA